MPLLTIGLVVVSLRRMAYYDEAFGLTMLRVWVVGATVWIGVMLAVLLHVTVGLAVIGASYLALERLARRSPVAAWVLAGVAVAASLVVFAVLSLG